MTGRSTSFPFFVAAMAVVVAASNILVQYPLPPLSLGGSVIDLSEILTYGAFSYPFAFLVTDLSNRRYGVVGARRVVLVGFALALLLSLLLAPWRIAVASASAFLLGQLLDVSLFDWLRRQSWWKAPLVSSVLASVLDTAVFFSAAFAGSEVPWITLALGDLAVKLAFAGFLLIPFRLLMTWLPAFAPVARA